MTANRTGRRTHIRTTTIALTVLVGLEWNGVAQGDSHIKALEQMLATVNAGDAAGYASLYSRDALVTIFGSGELKGRASIERHEVELLRQFPGARLAFYDVWRSGGATTVAHYAVHGRSVDGKNMGHEGLLFFDFDGSGLIQNERRYIDSLTPMAQLGALRVAAPRRLPRMPDELNEHVARRSAAEEANSASVRQMIDDLNAHREAPFLDHLSDDVSIDEVMLPRSFDGKLEAADWFRTWSGNGTGSRLAISSIVAVGDFVLFEAVMRGTLVRPVGLVAHGGKPYTIHRAAIVQLAAGKIRRLSAFTNGKELAESVGHWPLK